jgi:hypothetical protein
VAASGAAAACSKLRVAGLRARRAGAETAYSARLPRPRPKTFVAGPQGRDSGSDRLDHASEVDARDRVPRPTEPRRQAQEDRATAQDRPVAEIERRRTHAHQHLALADRRALDLPHGQDVG